MENNPIDKLFAQKLRHLEKAPRADVWDRIQVRKPEKKRGAFWWATIAASLLLLLISGGLSWQHFPPQKGDAVHADLTAQSSKLKVEQPLAPATPSIAAKQPEKRGMVAEERIVRKPKLKARPRHLPKSEPVPQPELIVVNPETLPTTTQPGMSAEETSVAEIKPTVLVMTIAEPSGGMGNVQPQGNGAPKNKANAAEESVAVEGKKKTRAGKILQQLKHIKNGEKVEWKEIGIHPENLLALVKPDRTTKNNSQNK